jgi:alanyl-tRNA synthetase
VKKTGEIGLLKVISCQNYKGGVRVSILCGRRALEYLRGEHDIIRELTGLLTTGQDKIIESVRRNADECSALKGRLAASNERLIEIEIAAIDADQSDVFLVKDKNLDGNLMRKTVNLLAAGHSGFCGIFSGSDDEGYKYIIASGSEGRDAAGLQGVLRSEFGAKGGGNAKMIQGSIPACSIKDILEYCMRK